MSKSEVVDGVYDNLNLRFAEVSADKTFFFLPHSLSVRVCAIKNLENVIVIDSLYSQPSDAVNHVEASA